MKIELKIFISFESILNCSNKNFVPMRHYCRVTVTHLQNQIIKMLLLDDWELKLYKDGLISKSKIIIKCVISCKNGISALYWCCRLHRLHLCRGVRPPSHYATSVLDMTFNNQALKSGECRVLLHSHYSQVHSDSEW